MPKVRRHRFQNLWRPTFYLEFQSIQPLIKRLSGNSDCIAYPNSLKCSSFTRRYAVVCPMLRIHSVTFHSVAPAGHPSPPARAGPEDSSQSPGKAAAFGDWFVQSPPPVCYWDRIHPQCAPTPPKSAAVRLHQFYPSSRLLELGYLFALFF